MKAKAVFDQVVQKIRHDQKAIVKEAAIGFRNDIARDTPVKTGTLQNNWMLTTGSRDSRILTASEINPKGVGLEDSDIYRIYNNVYYARFNKKLKKSYNRHFAQFSKRIHDIVMKFAS